MANTELTFNGDVTGKTVVDLNGIQYVKISDKPHDLTELVKFGLSYDPELAEAEGIPPYMEVPKEMYTIDSCAEYSYVVMYGQIAIASHSQKVEGVVFDVGVYVMAMSSGGKIVEWVSRIEFEETTEPEEPTAPGFIEYLVNPKYRMEKPFRGFIGWKLAQGGGGGGADVSALVSSDGYTLQDVNGLNLIPKEGK
jgi:hypothetical protein